jgi:hypothetical protein
VKNCLIVLAIAVTVAPLTASRDKKAKADDLTRVYDAPVDRVFLAAAQVAALNWNVTHSDKDTYTISFRTGMNLRTARGFDVTVVCIDRGGKTDVSVHPQRRSGGEPFSWKEGNRIASTFHKELSQRLGLTT